MYDGITQARSVPHGRQAEKAAEEAASAISEGAPIEPHSSSRCFQIW